MVARFALETHRWSYYATPLTCYLACFQDSETMGALNEIVQFVDLAPVYQKTNLIFMDVFFYQKIVDYIFLTCSVFIDHKAIWIQTFRHFIWNLSEN